MRAIAIALTIAAALLLVGQWSGNQPERDAVAAASAELALDFEASFVDVGEVTLHVVRAGPQNGVPVVLLHGFPEFWYAWRGPAAVLARSGYRVILPDQRGYNLSDKPRGVEHYHFSKLALDIVGLVDALGYEKVMLGAQDMGAGVAWRLVTSHPEHFARFAVINFGHPFGYANPTDEETVSWYRTFLQIPWLPGYTARLGNWRVLTGSLRDSSAEGAFPEDEMEQFRSAWDRDGAIHTMGTWYRAPFEPLDGDGRVSVPTLVIQAENDAFIPTDLSAAGMEYLDDGRRIELGSGTHWVAGEEPERIGRILADFFDEGP